MAGANDQKTKKVNSEDLGIKVMGTKDVIQETISGVLKELGPYLGNNNQQPAQNNGVSLSEVRSNVIKQMEAKFNEVIRSNQAFARKMSETKAKNLVRIRIPKVYRKYFGPYLPAGINGVLITIPIDNKYHKIPRQYLPRVEAALAYEDEKIDFMQRSGGIDILGVTEETLGN